MARKQKPSDRVTDTEGEVAVTSTPYQEKCEDASSLAIPEFNDGTLGTREICAWKRGDGKVVVQVRSFEHDRRLRQRQDGKLIGEAVLGGFLRLYIFENSMRWARRLVGRYLQKSANARFSGPTERRSDRKMQEVVR